MSNPHDDDAEGDAASSLPAGQVPESAKKHVKKRGAFRQWLKSSGRALLHSRGFQTCAAGCAYHFLRFVHSTNPPVATSHDGAGIVARNVPAIFAMWHGQHFMIPFIWPAEYKVDALISKSVDAEINAIFLQRFGIGTVRGSGGRDERQRLDRGGAKALLQLRRSLLEGRSVAMIADISHRQARFAGEGIVTLARLTGFPVIPLAFTSSRRHVFAKSWDKAALSLPFGRSALAMGAPMHFGPDDDVAEARQRLTMALNAVTDEAALLVGRIDPVNRTDGARA
jgi:lysophospholipid acyltransferase (LPLAT)-like uncharacterized protein